MTARERAERLLYQMISHVEGRERSTAMIMEGLREERRLERERCAKVCLEATDSVYSSTCADAIRALGDEE